MTLILSPVAVQGGVVERRVAARVPAVDSAIRSPQAEKKATKVEKRRQREREREIDKQERSLAAVSFLSGSKKFFEIGGRRGALEKV